MRQREEELRRRFLMILLRAGVDVVTMGNHTWDQKEIYDFIDETDYLIRPANFSDEAPGKGMTTISRNGVTLSVINLHGRTFLAAARRSVCKSGGTD